MMKKIKIITKRKSHLSCLPGAINEYKIPPIESWQDEVAETAEKELPIGTAAPPLHTLTVIYLISVFTAEICSK